MIVVLVMAATLWGIGGWMGAPRRARLNMLGVLLCVVIGAQLVLPEGHPVRDALGGSLQLWLLIFAAAVLVYLYARAVVWLRARRRLPPAPEAVAAADVELDRNARHIVLHEIGGAGQRRLKEARVLVVGAGGLGAPVLQYLGAAGVGTLGVIDDDVVENSNLARQVIHRDRDIGMPKVFSAQRAVSEQNPFALVRPYNRRLEADMAPALIEDYDIAVDCTDQYATRSLLNRVCVEKRVPLVSGALTPWEGQVTVFDVPRGTPCYHCLYPEPPAEDAALSCAQVGVFGPLPGIVGTIMAAEVIKRICDAGRPLLGVMMVYDAQDARALSLRIKPRTDCPVCSPLRP